MWGIKKLTLPEKDSIDTIVFFDMDLQKTEILYVGDPLCSWCYGIAPELQKLKDEYAPDIPFHTIVGGLRPYETQVMDKRMKAFLRDHWVHVQERSGNPFSYALLEKDAPEFVYNTERPCRAVVTVRKIAPDKTFEFFKSVQHAFYAENKDTNLQETYQPLLEGLGISYDQFAEQFESEAVRKETTDDFLWAKNVGVTGFPTVILKHEGQLFALALGYSTFERMKKHMDNILAGRPPGSEA